MNFRFSSALIFGLVVSFSLLLQGCSGGGSGGNVSATCSLGSGANVTISGNVSFERVHHYPSPSSNITTESVRGVVVELKCSTHSSTIVSTTTSDTGHYELVVPGNTDNLFVRVKAQMLQAGPPSWDFRVVDNTQSQALYSMDSSVFNSSSVSLPLHLLADSGWDVGSASYVSSRVAAPFAILDSVYAIVDKFQTETSFTMPNAFPQLKLNWSINNNSTEGDVTAGQIISSHYDGTQIYILGLVGSDADEYDQHVIIHEWGHYYEDKFSRADSVGGPHDIGDYLDMRVAFSEGFGNAFSAMILDPDPIYKDAHGSGQQVLFSFDIDDNTCAPYPGWHNECSVQSILYDLYDSPAGDDDVLSMGMAPIHNALTLTTRQYGTEALTSLFSFIHYLKLDSDVPTSADIDTLVGSQNLVSITDIYGSSETTVNNPGATDNLPVYSNIAIGGTVNVCSTGEFQGYNGVGVYRFLKFIASGGGVTITATKTSGISSSDPDIELFYKGLRIGTAWSIAVDTETLSSISLTAGETYIIQINEDDYFNAGYSGSGETCFDVTLN